MIGHVHSIESFGTVDGPGIRFVIFLQGCPLRCQFCHNPDTWELIGASKEMSVDELITEISKYKSYLKNGGVTVSGGEPLLQIDFVIELFTILKQKGIHTCVDTSGITFNSKQIDKFNRLCKVTDLVLLDIKTIRDDAHRILTGSSNKQILAFAKYLDKMHMPVWIRHVFLDKRESLEELKELRAFIETLSNVEKIEILPYHTMGIVKYKAMNIPYPLMDMEVPSKADIEMAKNIIVKGVKV
ncbi:MAG: pyruvate formate-lyase-activating protein [Erysipelotrichaceae bacterium]|nr:pyruvate formate-lyase-activating protein [Erysipelotrichaceae bacterium]